MAQGQGDSEVASTVDRTSTWRNERAPGFEAGFASYQLRINSLASESQFLSLSWA